MIGTDPIISTCFIEPRASAAFGRIEYAGRLKEPGRTMATPPRRIYCHGIVFVIDGGGRFKDGLGADIEVTEGDLIVLFPNIIHQYGPNPGGIWSEIYAHFNGPVFDPWSAVGLLNPSRPVIRQS